MDNVIPQGLRLSLQNKGNKTLQSTAYKSQQCTVHWSRGYCAFTSYKAIFPEELHDEEDMDMSQLNCFFSCSNLSSMQFLSLQNLSLKNDVELKQQLQNTTAAHLVRYTGHSGKQLRKLNSLLFYSCQDLPMQMADH